MDDAGDRAAGERGLISLGSEFSVSERFFQVAPLIVVGTKEPNGAYDLAPKHLAMPLSWNNYFGFVCTPAHATYVNAQREGVFTVSFPKPSQVVLASLAAAPRCEDDAKPSLALVETFPATEVDGVLLSDAYLHLECRTYKVFDDFDRNTLITGRVVEAHVAESAIRRSAKDDEELLFDAPLLAYVAPGRYAEVSRTFAFPCHAGMER